MTDPPHPPEQHQPGRDRPEPGAARPVDPARPGDADRPDRAARPDSDAGPDDATLDRVRQLLREEPVADDDLARERRLRVALAAAVPPARRAAPRRWLAAAAIVSVMGIGGYFLVAGGTGSDDETASNDAAMATEDESGAEGATVAPDAEPGSTGPALAEDGAPTTVTGMQQETAGAPSAPITDASVVDLGRVADLAAAIVAAEGLEERSTDAAEGRLRRIPDGQALRCIDQQRALGFEVIAVATLDGRGLVVVRSPTGPLVLDAVGCVPAEP